MTKMRVHELAKELGVDNKELVEMLHKKNVEVKNHMSTVEDDVADEIRREVSPKGGNKSDDTAEIRRQINSLKTQRKKKHLRRRRRISRL